MLRYSKLSDAEVLANLLDVCSKENVEYTEDGLEAVVFTAQGDMRQALNNLQSTFEGFGFVKSENVFKVGIMNLKSLGKLMKSFFSGLRRTPPSFGQGHALVLLPGQPDRRLQSHVQVVENGLLRRRHHHKRFSRDQNS